MDSKKFLLAAVTFSLIAAPTGFARAGQDQELQMAPDTVTVQPDGSLDLAPGSNVFVQMKFQRMKIEATRLQLDQLYSSLMKAPIRIEHDVAMADWSIRAQDLSAVIAAVTGVRAVFSVIKRQGLAQLGPQSMNGRLLWGSVLVAMLSQMAKNHYASDVVLTLQQTVELKKQLAACMSQLTDMEIGYDLLLSQMGRTAN